MNIQDFYSEAHSIVLNVLNEKNIGYTSNGGSTWSFYFELHKDYEDLGDDINGDHYGWEATDWETLRVSNHKSYSGDRDIDVYYTDPATSEEGTVLDRQEAIGLLHDLRADLADAIAHIPAYPGKNRP